MLWQILIFLLPFLALFYYLKRNWSEIKNNNLMLSLLIGGALVWFAGLIMQQYNFGNGSLLSLFGVCVFFSGVAFHTIRRPKKEEPTDEEAE